MGIKEKISECVPRKDPLARPHYTEAEAQAVRACYRGEATERQQRMLCDWLIRAAGTHDTSYRPGDAHATSFAEGKRHVGTTFIWMLFEAPTKTDPDKISTRKIEDESDGRAEQR